MQSKNQVVILGISIFEKSEQTIESNRSASQVRKKETAILLCCCRLDFKLLFTFTMLQCSARVQSKNGVDLVEVSIFL